MKPIFLKCPKCGAINAYRNWFQWIWHCPFHWFGKRLTQCLVCGEKSYMKMEK